MVVVISQFGQDHERHHSVGPSCQGLAAHNKMGGDCNFVP